MASRVRNLSLVGLLASAGAVAGPLNPPAGPVAPTHKTLSDVAPRIAINATNTPGDADSLYRITQPGSYYLTESAVVGSGLSGIEIEAGDVTIDLMGFTLRGEPGSLDGIRVPVMGRPNITIRNGVVRDFGQDGVDLRHAGTSNGGVVENIVASNNAGAGIAPNGNAVVRACVASGNGGIGINVAVASVIESSSAYSNGQGGIVSSGTTTVTSCVAANNTGSGISVGAGAVVTNSSARGNTTNGIAATQGAATISGCTVEGNGVNGIFVMSRSFVRDNVASGNGSGGVGAGIRVTGFDNRVEGNNVVDNERGVEVSSGANFIARNVASGNGVNWVVSAGNVCLVVDASVSAAINGDSGGVSPGSTNPNANFTY